MFAILRFTEPENKIRSFFTFAKITSERITLPSGGVYFIVTAEKHRGKIPWKKLEVCLGILRNDVILPEGASVPEDVNITVFSPRIFPRLLLINSAEDYIVKHKADFLSKSLTVFDEYGIYGSYIEGLLPIFSNIKIVTDKKEEYGELSDLLMKNYGFSLMVTDKESVGSDAVISHSCRVPLFFGGTLFTNERKHLMNSRPLSGNEILLPDLYENLRPDNVNRVLFASALYEKCGAEELKHLKYKDFGS